MSCNPNPNNAPQGYYTISNLGLYLSPGIDNSVTLSSTPCTWAYLSAGITGWALSTCVNGKTNYLTSSLFDTKALSQSPADAGPWMLSPSGLAILGAGNVMNYVLVIKGNLNLVPYNDPACKDTSLVLTPIATKQPAKCDSGTDKSILLIIVGVAGLVALGLLVALIMAVKRRRAGYLQYSSLEGH